MKANELKLGFNNFDLNIIEWYQIRVGKDKTRFYINGAFIQMDDRGTVYLIAKNVILVDEMVYINGFWWNFKDILEIELVSDSESFDIISTIFPTNIIGYNIEDYPCGYFLNDVDIENILNAEYKDIVFPESVMLTRVLINESGIHMYECEHNAIASKYFIQSTHERDEIIRFIKTNLNYRNNWLPKQRFVNC